MKKVGRRLRWACLLLTAGALVWLGGDAVKPQAAANPVEPGPCTITSQIVDIDDDLETHIYYPEGDQCDGGAGAPYPALAFAHGFSMFGLTDGAADNAGHGEHLASWGYVVAIPRLPDDAEGRIADMQDVLSYLETETNTSGSFLYHKVDTDRFAVAGHSFGGATVLALAARDDRVKAAVALDPVYHQGGPGENPEIWDHDGEGPEITAPTCILGAPSSNCNSEADYAEIYPFVGATHKAEFFIVGASHCDFMDPGDPLNLCSIFCDGDTDPERTHLVQKYMTAWFNYYVHYDTDYYDYLYGTGANSDIASGHIERQVDTAPRDVAATGQYKAVLLEWTLYDHPVVAGYNAYRRQVAETYPALPQIHARPTNSHLDEGLAGGEAYHYVLCSRDAADHEHELSAEVSATTLGEGPPEVTPTPEPEWSEVYLPCILKNWQR
jgi:dienelactone hydrolase